MSGTSTVFHGRSLANSMSQMPSGSQDMTAAALRSTSNGIRVESALKSVGYHISTAWLGIYNHCSRKKGGEENHRYQELF